MRVLFLISILLAGQGCCSSPASLGWRFEVGRAGTMNVPVGMHQLSGPLAMTPVGSNYGATTRTQFAAEEPAVEVLGPARRLALAGAPDCNLADVCRRLLLLEQQLRQRMPPGD